MFLRAGLNEIVKGERTITADTALRLGRYFKMSPQFWLNLQSHYDLEIEQDRLGRGLEREVKVLGIWPLLGLLTFATCSFVSSFASWKQPSAKVTFDLMA